MKQTLGKVKSASPGLPTVYSIDPGETFTLVPDGVVYMRLTPTKPSYPKGMTPSNDIYPPQVVSLDGCSFSGFLVPTVTLGTGRIVFMVPSKEVYPVAALVTVHSEYGRPNTNKFPED